jgi:biopolymer transport protein TolQ
MKHPQKPNAFTIPVRIYYEDTDAGGVVYYANYLKFFERCRSEWLRAIGHQQAELLRDPGIAFVVRSVSIDYLKPARLDDQLVVGLEVEKIRPRTDLLSPAYPARRCDCRRALAGTGQRHRAHRLRQLDADESNFDSRNSAYQTGSPAMNVSQDLSILHLILNASAVVQAVMLLLAGVSFMSWYYIFRKWFTVKAARAQTEQFERDFWSGGDLNSLYQSAINDRHSTGSMERIFEAGFREFTKLRSQKNLDPKDVIDGSRRAMRATYQREMDSIDSHLAFLASVGSVSPYVGLFGTVWGIMHSFRGLSNVGQATLAAVAPGIAEALVATAIGLFAAIPAVVAYNRFAHEIDRLSSRFESFMEEFSNILQRQMR